MAGDTAESIVTRADEALYDAKRRGKKRVETRPQSFLRGLALTGPDGSPPVRTG